MHLARRAFALVAPLVVPSLLAAQTYPSKDDPRSNLKPGRLDARIAVEEHAPGVVHAEAGGVRLGARPDVHQLRPRVRQQLRLPGQLRRLHDLGRQRPRQAEVVVGRRSASRRRATRRSTATCSSSPPRARATATTAAKGGVQDPKDHMAGVRIFDVSNPAQPKLVKNVQTCKGSHTHTIVPQPEGQGRHLPLRVGQPGRAPGDGVGRVQGTARTRPTRRTRSSGSTSSRCRSTTRSRPRS